MSCVSGSAQSTQQSSRANWSVRFASFRSFLAHMAELVV